MEFQSKDIVTTEQKLLLCILNELKELNSKFVNKIEAQKYVIKEENDTVNINTLNNNKNSLKGDNSLTPKKNKKGA